MYSPSSPGRSPIFYGILIGTLLIGLALAVRSCGPPPQSSLREHFVPGPTDPAGSGITLPEPVRSVAQTAQAQFQGGEDAPAITPEASSGPLSIDGVQVSKVDNGVRVSGSIRNTSSKTVTVPLSAFNFRDQTGTTYAAQGDAQAVLSPGQSELFDLTLPTPNPTELVLLINLPSEGINIEMVLLAEGATPTP